MSAVTTKYNFKIFLLTEARNSRTGKQKNDPSYAHSASCHSEDPKQTEVAFG